MALRSLAGKLAEKMKGLPPLRAEPPRPAARRPAAFDREKAIAQLHNPLIRDILKANREETRLFEEKAEKLARKYYRDSVLIAATGVVISAFLIAGIIKNLEELDKLKAEARLKAISSIFDDLKRFDKAKGKATGAKN